MMCQGNAMTVESRFLKILGGPVTVQQRGQTLTLSSREGSVTLRRTSVRTRRPRGGGNRSEEHTSELQSLMRISYAVFCLKKKKTHKNTKQTSDKNQQPRSENR